MIQKQIQFLKRCAFLIGFGLAATPLSAEDIYIQEERIENCLRFSEDRYQCVGSGSGACSDLPKGGSRAGMNVCLALERAYWNDVADKTLKEMIAKARAADAANAAEPDHVDLVAGITAMQDGFGQFRDSLCAAKWRGDEMQELMTNRCLMRQDGAQAIYLISLLEEHF